MAYFRAGVFSGGLIIGILRFIKCWFETLLLTKIGRARQEDNWLSVITHRPRCVRSVRDDLEPNTVEALVSDHLGNSEKWSQLELVAYENELS